MCKRKPFQSLRAQFGISAYCPIEKGVGAECIELDSDAYPMRYEGVFQKVRPSRDAE